ncbi:class I SAM-dependent methyltransferase [Cellulosimicrobium sp. SH8]|uniref:class I SAM-dependent methyltransferase n=1 Tax=Cellulosimicrobium sp. SH8 TaxID=2952936 RepID=UPI0021F3991A|nr:class I SAM-dependent methyltransferase [Cellulosimicrobium sp. SH8]
MRDPARWPAYNAAQRGRPVRDLCRRVLDLAGPGDGRLALDLGCGAGVETAAMLDAGWRVVALDPAPGTGDLVREVAGPGDRGRLTVHEAGAADVSTLVRPAAVQLVHASYALPHVPRLAFDDAWRQVRAALSPGGWLAVDLFGDRDSWVGAQDETFLSRAEVDDLLAGLDVVVLDEVEEDGEAFSGPKHWHTYAVVARAPG